MILKCDEPISNLQLRDDDCIEACTCGESTVVLIKPDGLSFVVACAAKTEAAKKSRMSLYRAGFARPGDYANRLEKTHRRVGGCGYSQNPDAELAEYPSDITCRLSGCTKGSRVHLQLEGERMCKDTRALWMNDLYVDEIERFVWVTHADCLKAFGIEVKRLLTERPSYRESGTDRSNRQQKAREKASAASTVSQ